MASAASPPGEIPTPHAPGRAGRWARRALGALGWRVDIAWPPEPRCVIVVYPHTSNWDFVYGYLARLAAALPVQWIGKDELFRGPAGALFRRMGGIPVNRREHTGLIGQMAAEMRRRNWLWLVIAPEGTRARTDHWKSGFYRLAREADVPVGLAYIDYARRVVGLDTYLRMTGDEEADLARIRDHYRDKVGKRPEKAGTIRFRAE